MGGGGVHTLSILSLITRTRSSTQDVAYIIGKLISGSISILLVYEKESIIFQKVKTSLSGIH
jgi:hypothetical protein